MALLIVAPNGSTFADHLEAIGEDYSRLNLPIEIEPKASAPSPRRG
jgi:hypothetical protein